MFSEKIYKHEGVFTFENGESLEGMQLKYYCSPRPYRPGEKVVWLCHALTGNANPEDWWPQMVGEGKPVDPEREFVVCVAMLCSAYGLCGPAAAKPVGDGETCGATSREGAGRPYLLDFPKTTIRDMARATDLVRRDLGMEKIDLLIGPSIGGFVAYEWLLLCPELFAEADLVATTFRTPPYMTAFNESQRMAIKLDPTFLEARNLEGGAEGLKCARAQALISYRTPEGYNLTQPEKDDDVVFADRAASYQRYQGQKLVSRSFDAYSYWYLTYALDSMNVGRNRGGVEKALRSIRAKVRLVSITTDQLFPPSMAEYACSLIPECKHTCISSAFGHDGFLIENDCLIKALDLG